jgi:hypothetical protein
MDKLRLLIEKIKEHAGDPWAQGYNLAEFAGEALAVVEDQERRIVLLENATQYTPPDVGPLSERIKALESKPVAAIPAPVDLGPLLARLDALEHPTARESLTKDETIRKK